MSIWIQKAIKRMTVYVVLEIAMHFRLPLDVWVCFSNLCASYCCYKTQTPTYSNSFPWKIVWHCLSLRQSKVSHSLQTARSALKGKLSSGQTLRLQHCLQHFFWILQFFGLFPFEASSGQESQDSTFILPLYWSCC